MLISLKLTLCSLQRQALILLTFILLVEIQPQLLYFRDSRYTVSLLITGHYLLGTCTLKNIQCNQLVRVLMYYYMLVLCVVVMQLACIVAKCLNTVRGRRQYLQCTHSTILQLSKETILRCSIVSMFIIKQKYSSQYFTLILI